MSNRTVAVVAALSLSSAVAAQAELPDGGGRVRLALQTSDGKRLAGRLVGQVVASGPDTLTLLAGEREVVVKRADVWRVEHSLGRRSRGAAGLRGAAIGLAIGAALGAGIGALAGDDRELVVDCQPYYGFGFGPLCGPLFTFSARDKAIMGGMALGTVGAVLGGIGGAAAPGERWQKASAERVRLSVGPRQGGVGAGVQVSF